MAKQETIINNALDKQNSIVQAFNLSSDLKKLRDILTTLKNNQLGSIVNLDGSILNLNTINSNETIVNDAVKKFIKHTIYPLQIFDYY